MNIILYCHISVGTAQVDEEIGVEAPDDFFTWTEDAQYEYFREDYEIWMSNHCDSGYSFFRK